MLPISGRYTGTLFALRLLTPPFSAVADVYRVLQIECQIAFRREAGFGESFCSVDQDAVVTTKRGQVDDVIHLTL